MWPEARRVFLADGDALALPTERLLAILEHLAAALPRLARVSCYATPGNLLRKRPDELRALRTHKLRLLYVGIESGADPILKKITKGATQRGIAEALTKAEECGVKVSGTVILGLGGTDRWKEHIDGTLELLQRAPLSYLSTLQLYLDASIAEEFHRQYDEPFTMPDDAAILAEQERLVRRARAAQGGHFPLQPRLQCAVPCRDAATRSRAAARTDPRGDGGTASTAPPPSARNVKRRSGRKKTAFPIEKAVFRYGAGMIT